jgi:hypothetical protein
MNTELQTKLGTARRVERSRIWIEGKRLTAAGFAVGRYFIAEWQDKVLTLTLLDADTIIADAPRKVSGKGDKPIIDITGAQVRETFGHGTHVLASFAAGVITITEAKLC